MQRTWLALALAALGACASAPIEATPLPPGPVEPPSQAPEPAPAPEPEPMDTMPAMRAKLPVDSGAFYVPTSDALHPRVHYVDGQDSLNDSCIVLAGNKLSRRVPPAFVNGRPIGFC
jgi:hypothetical protein